MAWLPGSGRLGRERQRQAVHAVAQARGLGAVVEDMAQVAAAAAAMHLGAQHAVGAVLARGHGLVQRLPEAGPAGAAVELGLGREQRQRAARAGKGAGAVLLVQGAGAGALRAFLAQDLVLLGREPDRKSVV